MASTAGFSSSGWIWLLCSWAVAVLWANLGWVWRRAPAGALSRAVNRVVGWPYSGWLLQLARLLYYVGLPFAALVWGHDAVNARLLGLQRVELPLGSAAVGTVVAENWLDWLRDLGWAAALGVGLWALLAVAWWRLRRALAAARLSSPPVRLDTPWVLLREAVFHEAHWAFYRNAPVLALGSTYWGAWIALALVGLEALLNPAWRVRMQSPEHNLEGVMRVALAVVSSALFLETANLWLAIGLHFGVSLGLAVFTRALPLPATAEGVAR
jgi:hypothetical protein